MSVVAPAVLGAVERSMRGRAALVAGAVLDGEQAVRGAGRTRKAGGKPDGDALFEIGAITELFTAALLAVMAARGEVELDEPLAGLLPGVDVPERRGRPILLEHLAAHLSGLPRQPRGLWRDAYRSPSNPYARSTEAGVLQALGRARLGCVPGDRYRYSHFGVAVLGLALARRAGGDYETTLRERVTGPLFLEDTVVIPSEGQRERLASGHSALGRPVPAWELGGLVAAAGLRSTGYDLLRFLRAALDGADSPLGDAVERTLAPRAQTRRGQVCLGWHRSELPRAGGIHMLWHDGATGGFRSFVGIVPERAAGAVVLSSTAKPVEHVGALLLADLCGVDAGPG